MERDTSKAEALEEIKETMKLTNFYARNLGLSFLDDPPKTFTGNLKILLRFAFSAMFCTSLVFSEMSYVISVMIKNPTVEQFVSTFHLFGYGLISLFKMWVLWYKQDVFRQLVMELQDLWPVRTDDEEANQIKIESLRKLRLYQFWYSMFNEMGVILFMLTPIILYCYHLFLGEPADLGFVWPTVYYFDKHQPVIHELTFVYEMIAGQSSVSYMLSTDLVFTALTSHINMLLRLLQLKIRRLGVVTSEGYKVETHNVDCLEDIVECVKIHQRLMRYFYDLEKAFTFANFNNIIISSMDICCVVFTIALLEPWMEMSNKLFLMASTTQVLLLCWYADDLCSASTGVADAVYESGWYKCNPKCRKYMIRILQRSQKPLYYTAMKFSNITLRTYASTITTAYSYFTLLYTMYK